MNEWHWSRDSSPWVACWPDLIHLAMKHVHMLAPNQNGPPEPLITWNWLQSAHAVLPVISHSNTQPPLWYLPPYSKAVFCKFRAWIIRAVITVEAWHADTNRISAWVWYRNVQTQWRPLVSPTLVTVSCKCAAKVANVRICAHWKPHCEEGLFNFLLAVSQHLPGLFFSLHDAKDAASGRRFKHRAVQHVYIGDITSNTGEGMCQLPGYVAESHDIHISPGMLLCVCVAQSPWVSNQRVKCFLVGRLDSKQQVPCVAICDLNERRRKVSPHLFYWSRKTCSRYLFLLNSSASDSLLLIMALMMTLTCHLSV